MAGTSYLAAIHVPKEDESLMRARTHVFFFFHFDPFDLWSWVFGLVRLLWVIGYRRDMGYGVKITANQLGISENAWVITELYHAWVMSALTVPPSSRHSRKIIKRSWHPYVSNLVHRHFSFLR